MGSIQASEANTGAGTSPWNLALRRMARSFATIQYAVAVFLGAFLLFQIQPIVGKYMLPWFGGSAAVWTTSLLFFQICLLGGYAYAHLLGRRSSRRRAVIHGVLLIASLATLPIDLDRWLPESSVSPTLSIFLLLAGSIGLPFLVLSSTGPLIQRLFANAHPDRSPYRLYALSNAGSLLALLSYPFVIEPYFTRGAQLLNWSVLFLVFVGVNAACVSTMWRRREVKGETRTVGVAKTQARPSAVRLVIWLALAASASALLMSTTTQLTQNVGSAPFLWIWPFALYLVTFMICFDSDRWYDRRVFGSLLFVFAAATVYVLFGGFTIALWVRFAVLCLTMFLGCMVCHGELSRSRPHVSHLTLFYLIVATGGALGGIAATLIAPSLLDGLWEFHLTVASALILGVLCWFFDGKRSRGGWYQLPLWATLALATIGICLGLGLDIRNQRHGNLARSRGFYGVTRVVYEPDAPYRDRLVLYNGDIKHGEQYLRARWRNAVTTYYGTNSGIGLALGSLAEQKAAPLRVGVIGLGVGTIAGYGRPGDTYRFYEISPDVVAHASEHFTYLDDSRAETEIIIGDARMKMREELSSPEPPFYDVLAVDAFVGDAIPMHLLTAECGDLYAAALKPDGALLLHISNRFVDLMPVVEGLAEHLGTEVIFIESAGNELAGTSEALWAILARDVDGFLTKQDPDPWMATLPGPDSPPSLLWTDDFASLWPVLEF